MATTRDFFKAAQAAADERARAAAANDLGRRAAAARAEAAANAALTGAILQTTTGAPHGGRAFWIRPA